MGAGSETDARVPTSLIVLSHPHSGRDDSLFFQGCSFLTRFHLDHIFAGDIPWGQFS